jgi:hypothetical protein
MLLIAIPKSASTSLVHTLGKMLNIKVYEGIAKKEYDFNCEGFSEIQKYHSNMVERSGVFLNLITGGRHAIYREHLLPTYRHIKILLSIKRKVVLLLRNPDDVIDSYRRLKRSSEIDFKKLSRDVNVIYNKYINLKGKEKICIIHYKDLILNYKNTIRKIYNFWGIRLPKKIIPLMRIKYTGVGDKRLKEKK